MISVLTGRSRAGKTTVCARLVALARSRGVEVTGLTTEHRARPSGPPGLDVVDVRSGEHRPLAEPDGPADGPSTEHWHFHRDGVSWGEQVIARAVPTRLLIVDELGPLELARGEGWRAALDVLGGGGYELAVVTIRPALLSAFHARMPAHPIEVIETTEENRDALPAALMSRIAGHG